MAWDYRELLWFLARRDLVVRYRQTMAGLSWLLFRPAMQVLMFTVVFGTIARLPDGGVPYPVLAMSGVVTWGFFHAIVNQATIALANNQPLITKVHFPRILLPLGTVLPNLIDLVIALAALTALMWWYGVVPSWRVCLLPIPIALTAMIALGIGLWTSAGSVRYRDLRQLVPFLLQVLMIFSPVGYGSATAVDRLGELGAAFYQANPLVAPIDLFRWCVLPTGYGPAQTLTGLLASLGAGLAILIGGQWYFRHAERTFADVI